MSTPTPETDAYLREMGDSAYCDFSGVEHIDSSFARKIERERNEAREALSGRTVSCSQCNESVKKVTELEAQIVRIKKSHEETERDEIEAMREAIKEAYDAIDEARECVYDKVSLWRVVDINLPKCKAALAKLKHFLP